MAANNEHPFLEQITQNPLLISPTAEGLFQASIQSLVASEHSGRVLDAAMSSGDDDDDFWPGEDDEFMSWLRPYNVRNGVLMIPVQGVLLNQFPYSFGRWATGYKYIEKAMERGAADPNVRGIALVENSPGGEVAGCFECADKIFNARGSKPIRAFAHDHAYSAAYAIASAADSIIMTRSGGVGSIGVVTAHVDYSKALEKAGVKVTFIFAGDHKVDGNPYEKLPESVKSRIQERINRIYGVFTSTVARNRSMDEQAVRDTKALTYDASEALDVGLADKVGSFEDEMKIFSEEVAATKDANMAGTNDTATAPANTVDKAVHDAAVAAATAAGAKAEKERITAILGCDEGKARPKAAFSCAMNTDMSFDQAKGFLAGLDEEKPEAKQTPAADPNANAQPGKPAAAGATPFDKAMDASGNPNVGASAGNDDEDKDDDAKASASILADYGAASGHKAKTA